MLYSISMFFSHHVSFFTRTGIIILKMETWHKDTPTTNGWTEENNGKQQEGHRELKGPPPEPCDNFQFQFAIDGSVTSWGKDEFLNKKTSAQRVVDLVTIMDDEEMAKEQKERNVQLAIRLQGCGTTYALKFTHVYWA